MRYIRGRVLLALAAGMLTVSIAAPSALATVDRVPVAGCFYLAEVYEYNNSFTGNAGHEYMHGLYRFEGHDYLAGWVEIEIRNQFNFVTGDGSLNAKLTWIEVDSHQDAGWTGTAVGDWTFDPDDFYLETFTLESQLVATGTGEFKGMHLVADDFASFETVPFHLFDGEVKAVP